MRHRIVRIITAIAISLLLVACTGPKRMTVQDIDFYAENGESLPNNLRMTLVMEPDLNTTLKVPVVSKNRKRTVQHAIISECYSAANAVFGRMGEISHNTSFSPHLIANIKNINIKRITHNFYSVGAIDLYWGTGEFIRTYKGEKQLISVYPSTTHLPNYYNSYIKLFESIAEQIIAEESFAQYFTNGFDDVIASATPNIPQVPHLQSQITREIEREKAMQMTQLKAQEEADRKAQLKELMKKMDQSEKKEGLEGSQFSSFFVETTFPRSLNAENNSDAIAVVIGNQEYSNKDIPSVSYAVNDASAVKKYLVDALGYKDGNIIYITNATKASLEMIFGAKNNHRGMLYNYVKPHKSDVFIYYSGHGAPDPNTNRAYIVPANCNPAMMDLTAYPLDVLYGNLPKIEAKSISVVLDACFSGGTNTGQFLVQNASPALIKINNPVISQNNLTIITSAENNQVSSWYPEKNHSMFTYFFLTAVTGSADVNQDKQITYQEIYDYVADRAEGVPYYAKRLHGGRVQNPTMRAANKDAVFVKY